MPLINLDLPLYMVRHFLPDLAQERTEHQASNKDGFHTLSPSIAFFRNAAAAIDAVAGSLIEIMFEPVGPATYKQNCVNCGSLIAVHACSFTALKSDVV
jgi:hypothetical protein